MLTDHQFGKEADAHMSALWTRLCEFDPDEVEADLSMGVLSIVFGDQTKAILNRQVAAHQIWLASGATAWHFEKGQDSGAWLDTKGRGELTQVLQQVLTQKLGRPVTL